MLRIRRAMTYRLLVESSTRCLLSSLLPFICALLDAIFFDAALLTLPGRVLLPRQENMPDVQHCQ